MLLYINDSVHTASHLQLLWSDYYISYSDCGHVNDNDNNCTQTGEYVF